MLAIKKVVNGGWGLAIRPNGKTVLVRHALPGETVAIAVEKEQRHLDFARIVEIVTAAPGRIVPPCPYYGRCGGCDLQHAAYPLQCSIKQAILADLLARSPVPLLKDQAGTIAPVLAAPQPFGYRQRIRLQTDRNGAVGFYRCQSHRVIDVNRCLLAHESINQTLQGLRDRGPFHRLAAAAEAIELLADPADGSVFACFQMRRPPRASERSLAEHLCHEPPGPQRVLLRGRGISDVGPFTCPTGKTGRQLSMTLPAHPPLELSWDVTGFSQVNVEQNRALVGLVVDLAKATRDDQVLDLFCGMGNFSLPLARSAGGVLGLESQDTAIRWARHNAEHNVLPHLSFNHSEVASGCSDLAKQQRRFDIIVSDPPRQGMPGLAPLLSVLCRKRLIYVSCDPATLCRDLGDLLTAGFRLRELRPLDMFPQTHHLETVAVLEKH